MPIPTTACLILVLAQAPPDVDANSEQARKLTTEAAREYQFLLAEDSESRLTFHPTPILRWSNPVVGEIYGNVFVWTDAGRPAAVGSFLKWFSPFTHGADELHSLATAPLRVERNDKQVWNPAKPGIVWKPLSDAPAPQVTAALRLQQFRRLAREFSCEKTDRDDEKTTLRLLTQPVFRYSSREHHVQDGAMFAFVLGTDPEAFLLIEAIESNGQAAWQYAIARMNSEKLVMRRGDRTVWNAELLPWAVVKDRSQPYTSFPRRNLAAK